MSYLNTEFKGKRSRKQMEFTDFCFFFLTSCVLCRNEKIKYSIIIKRNQKYQNWFLLKKKSR